MKIGTRNILAMASVAGVLLGGPALAGEKATGLTVNIYGSGLRVNGSIGAVRNSANTIEYLGCKITASSTAAPSVSCSAQNSAGVQFSCSTSNAGMVSVASTISGDSFVTINRDTAGACTLIAVDNSSIYIPKAP